MNTSHFEALIRRLEETARTLITPFIRLGRQSKVPIDTWSQEKNHISKELALTQLNDGKNAGIVAHVGGLVFLDIDVTGGKTKLPEDKVSSLVEHFDTFTTQTRNGGKHLYFVNGGIPQNSLLYYDNLNIGELRVSGQYIVAPGSYVPPDENATPEATGVYTVVRDVPIKTLNLDFIPDWLHLGRDNHNKRLDNNQIEKTTEKVSITGFQDIDINTISNRYGSSLKDIRQGNFEFSKELDELLKGANQGQFTSRSEADFRTAKILWKYWFDEFQIAAILQACRRYEKTLREDYLARTIYRAIEDAQARGWKRDWLLVPQNTTLTSLERISITELPEKLPDKRYVLVRGIPRSGKTRWSVLQLIKAVSGIFVSHRHSITRHAIGMFKKLSSTKTAVLLMGKDACCNREDGEKGRCADCPKRLVSDDLVEEGNGISKTQYFREAYALLNQNRVLTEREIPQHLCPHFALKFAEQYADYCFTVPYFYANEDSTVLIRPRSLVVLDEDPVVDYFYPTTIELAEFQSTEGKVFSSKNFLSDYIPPLDNLEKYIINLPRKSLSDRRILDIIRMIREEINPLLAKLVDTPSKGYKEELVDKLKEIHFPILTDIERYETLKRVKHHLKELPTISNVSISAMFESFLFPAQKNLIWIGHNPNTLYLVGKRTIIRSPNTEQLVIIGSTNAELFLEQLCAESPQDAVVLDIAEFKYKDNFIVLRLNGEDMKHEGRMMLKFIRLLAEGNRNRDDPVPGLILTSSKKNQQHVWDRLQSAAKMSRDETADQQIMNWLTGELNIFFTNSTLSRGVDVPYYDILLVQSCTYVQPYWDSEIIRGQENGDRETEMRASIIRSQLISDELTNSVLRHSPVYGVREDQVKFIVVKSRDFKKISEKVTNGMFVVDIYNNIELEKIAARVPEMVTRASQPVVREKIGFNEVFLSAHEALESLDLSQVLEGTAIVLGKTSEDAKAVFKNDIIAVTSEQKNRDALYFELCEKIKTYPSFTRGCRGQQRAIVKWMHIRYPTISERRVKRTLKMMVSDGTLRSEKGKHNKIMYSLRAEKIVDQGRGQLLLNLFGECLVNQGNEIVEVSP